MLEHLLIGFAKKKTTSSKIFASETSLFAFAHDAIVGPSGTVG